MDDAADGRAHSRRSSSGASPGALSLDSSLVFADDFTIMDTQQDHQDPGPAPPGENMLDSNGLPASASFIDLLLHETHAEDGFSGEAGFEAVATSRKLIRGNSPADTQKIDRRSDYFGSNSLQDGHVMNQNPHITDDTQKVLRPADAFSFEADTQVIHQELGSTPNHPLIGLHNDTRSIFSLAGRSKAKLVRAHSLAETQKIKPYPNSARAKSAQESQGLDYTNGTNDTDAETQRIMHHGDQVPFEADTQVLQKRRPSLEHQQVDKNGLYNHFYNDTQHIQRPHSGPMKILLSNDVSQNFYFENNTNKIDASVSLLSNIKDTQPLNGRESPEGSGVVIPSQDPDSRNVSFTRNSPRSDDLEFSHKSLEHGDTLQNSHSPPQSSSQPVKPNGLSSVGNHTSVPTHLHRQVINTQDQSGIEGYEDPPAYDNGDDKEEFNTYDECDIDTHEDSILTYRNRKRRRAAKNGESLSISLQKEPRIMNGALTKVERMLPPPTLEVIASPSEIGESSPTIKKCDLLGSLVSLSPTRVLTTLEMQVSRTGCENTTFDSPVTRESIVALEEDDITCLTQINRDVLVKDDDSPANTPPQKQSSSLKPEMPFASKHRAKFVVDSQSIDSYPATASLVLRRESQSVLHPCDSIVSSGVWVSYDLKILTGRLVEESSGVLRVEFSEGEYQVKTLDLSPLDIRIGDTVHIKQSACHKYIVTGLSSVDSDSQPGSDIRCVRGYNCVHIVRKRHTRQDPEKIVPLSTCFMELSDFISRQPAMPAKDSNIVKNDPTMVLEPPVNHNHIPFSSPVGTRSNRTSPQKLFKKSVGDKVFSNTLFFVTGYDADQKRPLRTMIESNGGLLVNESPCELLKCISSDEGALMLDGSFMTRFLFAALLSPSHCRSAKYLQTVALGWPILSSVYIEDCVKNLSCIDEWPLYLLPSGHSSIFQSVQSFDTYRFRSNFVESRNMAEQVRNNLHLLAKHAVFLVEKDTNPDALVTCKHIFHAFGAKLLDSFQHQHDIVSTLLARSAGGRLRHFLVYDESGTFAESLVSLSANSVPAAGRAGRTRSKASKPSMNRVSRDLYATAHDDIEISTVNWEWLVQCVISTHIWPAPTITISREMLST